MLAIRTRMNREKKRFGRLPVGEAVVWLLPAFLGAFAHLYAFPKAGMSDAGPGIHIALMNNQTIMAQQVWQFVDSLYHPFLLYGILLLAVFLLLRMGHIPVLYRVVILVSLAIPGLWYFRTAFYLGGKIIIL